MAIVSPIPSKTLLRFLRSQTDGVCFFTSNTNAGSRRQKALNSISTPSRRQLSTTPYPQARVPSSFIDELWPRHRECTPKALPAPKHQHHQHDYKTISGSRHASTSSASDKSFFSRLWHRNRVPSNPRGLPNPDLPFQDGSYDDTSAQLFNLSRALSRNSSGADLKLRCTEFDANGSVTLVSGEFKKSELIAKYGLLPRDLRKIDSSVLPHILVRPSAILINLLHLRVLIQSDRVLVFDAYGSTDSYTQSLFMYDLEGKLRQKSDPKNTASYLPYEFRALEAVLISVTSGLESEFEGVRDPVVRVLRALEEDIDREKLRHLLIHSKKLGTFEQKARLVRDAIDDLLDADDDLSAMYLTEHKQLGHPRTEDDHTEVEMLLESYHKICDEIVEISGNLISNIRNTEEVVKAILDANRNQLMLLELKFSIGTLGLAGGTLIAGLYGMNLENFIEESHYSFAAITGVCVGLSALIAVYGMRKLRKVQKVRMWGEDVNAGTPQTKWWREGRGNWRSEAIESSAESKGDWMRRRKMLDSAGASASARANAAGAGGGRNGGPVLWPGMEGLGLHKFEAGPGVTVHDDVSTGGEGMGIDELKERDRAREKMALERKKTTVVGKKKDG